MLNDAILSVLSEYENYKINADCLCPGKGVFKFFCGFLTLTFCCCCGVRRGVVVDMLLERDLSKTTESLYVKLKKSVVHAGTGRCVAVAARDAGISVCV
jgi:hypothetical protein